MRLELPAPGSLFEDRALEWEFRRESSGSGTNEMVAILTATSQVTWGSRSEKFLRSEEAA